MTDNRDSLTMSCEYAGVPEELRAQYVAVQAKFSASIGEGASVDWAARAVIQDEFALVCGQISDSLCGKDSLLALVTAAAQDYWRDMAKTSRRIVEQRADRAGGVR